MRSGGHLHPATKRRHDERTRSEQLADRMTAVFGSWKFILVQTMIVLWIGLNLLHRGPARRRRPAPLYWQSAQQQTSASSLRAAD